MEIQSHFLLQLLRLLEPLVVHFLEDLLGFAPNHYQCLHFPHSLNNNELISFCKQFFLLQTSSEVSVSSSA